MKINQELDPGSYSIRSINANSITVLTPADPQANKSMQAQVLSNSFVMMPKRLITDWPVRSVTELKASQITELLALDPELILLGTGAQLVFPEPELLYQFSAQGIGVEVMDTPAACRTYNILMHEGRHVAAAIMQHGT